MNSTFSVRHVGRSTIQDLASEIEAPQDRVSTVQVHSGDGAIQSLIEKLRDENLPMTRNEAADLVLAAVAPAPVTAQTEAVRGLKAIAHHLKFIQEEARNLSPQGVGRHNILYCCDRIANITDDYAGDIPAAPAPGIAEVRRAARVLVDAWDADTIPVTDPDPCLPAVIAVLRALSEGQE